MSDDREPSCGSSVLRGSMTSTGEEFEGPVERIFVLRFVRRRYLKYASGFASWQNWMLQKFQVDLRIPVQVVPFCSSSRASMTEATSEFSLHYLHPGQLNPNGFGREMTTEMDKARTLLPVEVVV